jgi:hypothetical protein
MNLRYSFVKAAIGNSSFFIVLCTRWDCNIYSKKAVSPKATRMSSQSFPFESLKAKFGEILRCNWMVHCTHKYHS